MGGPEVLRALALRVAGPFELLAFRRRGVQAGVEAIGHSGGAGTDDDGVWRTFDARPGPGRITYRERRAGAAEQQEGSVRTADVLEWAAERLTAADWDQLARLEAEWGAAVHAYWGDNDLVHRSTYRPEKLTDDDRVWIVESRTTQFAAERALRRLVTDRLSAEVPPAGEQMSLFG